MGCHFLLQGAKTTSPVSPALAGRVFTTVLPGKPGFFFLQTAGCYSGKSVNTCMYFLDPGFPEASSRVAPSFLSALVGSPGLLPLQASTRQDSCERREFQKGKTMVMGRVTWGCISRKARSSRWQSKPNQRLWARVIFLSFFSPAAHSISCFNHSLYFSQHFFFPSPLIYCSTKFRSLCVILVFEANVQFGII